MKLKKYGTWRTMYIERPHLQFIGKALEPRSEKTGLWGFRPGRIQTRLYSHRR